MVLCAASYFDTNMINKKCRVGRSKTKWRCEYDAFYNEMLLGFPSIPSNQVSGESESGNFTDFWATQYDRQSIWSNFKKIESPTDLYSLPSLFIKLEWQVRFQIFC